MLQPKVLQCLVFSSAMGSLVGCLDATPEQFIAEMQLPDVSKSSECEGAAIGAAQPAIISLDEYARDTLSRDRFVIDEDKIKCDSTFCYGSFFEPLGDAGWRRIMIFSDDNKIVAIARCFEEVLPNATCSVHVQTTSGIAQGSVVADHDALVAASLNCVHSTISAH